MKSDISIYCSDERLERMKKRVGDELTYSIYCHLRDMGFAVVEIQRMYGLEKNEVYRFAKAHEEVLNNDRH